MSKKTYKTPDKAPMTVGESAVAYETTISQSTSSDKWNPNVPFHGTQEEWWDHFHQIEEGEFSTWEEHQKRFKAWKKEFLSNHM
jgi:hypothetical protein